MAAQAEIPNGARVFFLHPDEAWQLGKVVDKAPPQRSRSPAPGEKKYQGPWYKVAADSGGECVVPGDPGHIYKFLSDGILEEDPKDLLELSELHEGPLLHIVKKRYQKDVIYTFIGRMVLALNPFSWDIPAYKPERLEDYLHAGQNAMDKGSRLLPHTWSLGKAAYEDMQNNATSQTLLVSGESGAGKTEAVKLLLRFIGRLSSERAGDPDGHSARLQSRIAAASPILECFGNAKTERNDNSSRFGKFLRLQFDARGRICGAKTDIYLLEKSRVIRPASDRGRVYHSFHQLLCGGAGGQHNLGVAADYPGASKNPKIDGVDDKADFAKTSQAMTEVGISPAEQQQVWAVVAGILHLTRVRFVPGADDSSTVAPDTAGFLRHAATAWGVPEAALTKEITTTTVMMGRDVLTKNCKPAQAQSALESVCKEVYTILFHWLVRKVNEGTQAAESAHFIGLLDIFGFESFEHNGFEQLCINLANEMLQKHYNDHIFKADKDECVEEGLDVSHIVYKDNQVTVDLLSKKRGGILALLDDQCKTHPEKDESFLAKVEAQHKDHESFYKGPLDHGRFTVRHYAGPVQYTVDGMGVKNADSLKEGVVGVLKASTNALVQELVGGLQVEKTTVSTVFRSSLLELIGVINTTQPSWVRCIKPNPAKRPREFHAASTSEQLRCSGVLDTINIRKAGYPVRIPLPGFVGRYRCLLDAPPPRGADPAGAARAIVAKLALPVSQAQQGRTKLFLKTGAANTLEDRRREALHHHQILIVRHAMAEYRSRAAVGEACRRRWHAAFALVAQVEAALRPRIAAEEDAALAGIAQQMRADLARIAPAAKPPSVVAAHADAGGLGGGGPGGGPALPPLDTVMGLEGLLAGYRPPPAMPPPPPPPEWGTYMLFARGPWPVYVKPRPGMHEVRDGKPFMIEPLQVVVAKDTTMITGEAEGTEGWLLAWLELKEGGWVQRRAKQASAKATDDWHQQGFHACADPAALPAMGPMPSSWHNRDGHRVQRIGAEVE